MTKTIRKVLTGRRKRMGLSQAALAGKLDVSERTIRNWEHGTHAPTWAQLDAWYAATAEEQGRGE